MTWLCTCGSASDYGHQYGCTGTLARRAPPVSRFEARHSEAFKAGAAVAFGLMGMAEAIGRREAVLCDAAPELETAIGLHWTKCLKCHEDIMDVVDVEPLCVRCANDEAVVNRTDDESTP